jgi:hypothetical protein
MSASGLHHQPASSLERTFFVISHLHVILYASLFSCVWHQVNNYRVLCSWLHTPNAGAGPGQGMAATAPVRRLVSYLLFSSLFYLILFYYLCWCMQAYLNAGRDEMDLATSASHIDLQGMAREAAAGNNKQANKIKIALSLYKVQQNIYLLDFQRVEVREHCTVCLEMLLCFLRLSSNQYTLMTKLSHLCPSYSHPIFATHIFIFTLFPHALTYMLCQNAHSHICCVKTHTHIYAVSKRALTHILCQNAHSHICCVKTHTHIYAVSKRALTCMLCQNAHPHPYFYLLKTVSSFSRCNVLPALGCIPRYLFSSFYLNQFN